MGRPPINVYVVDDDSLLGMGLAQLLEGAGCVATAFASAEAFLSAYPQLPPGCIIVDIVMQGMNGLELQRRLIAAGCKWPVILLTGYGDRANAERAMEAGAVAFLEKPARYLELLAALLRGESHLSGATDAIPDLELAYRLAQLTRRERDVLGCVLDNMRNRQIAAKFGISESSVKGYRRRVIKRLGARTPVELVMLALRGGFTAKPRS